MENVRNYFKLEKTSGEVGIEIEMEGDCLPQEGETPSGWYFDKDGSLRGEAAEYVLSKPVDRDSVAGLLALLKQAFVSCDSTLRPSNRCGVHVHINCQQLNKIDLYKFIGLYLILEDVLVHYCGEEREGNLFCLRARDAEGLLMDLHNAIENRISIKQLANGTYRYSSLNICSLRKYGSLEFRSLNTMKNIAEINTWVELLLCVKDASKEYESLRGMVESFSALGATRVMQSIFGSKAELLNFPNLDGMVMAGLRRVQNLAYAAKPILPIEYIKYAKQRDRDKEIERHPVPGGIVKQPRKVAKVEQMAFEPQADWMIEAIKDYQEMVQRGEAPGPVQPVIDEEGDDLE